MTNSQGKAGFLSVELPYNTQDSEINCWMAKQIFARSSMLIVTVPLQNVAILSKTGHRSLGISGSVSPKQEVDFNAPRKNYFLAWKLTDHSTVFSNAEEEQIVLHMPIVY